MPCRIKQAELHSYAKSPHMFAQHQYSLQCIRMHSVLRTLAPLSYKLLDYSYSYNITYSCFQPASPDRFSLVHDWSAFGSALVAWFRLTIGVLYSMRWCKHDGNTVSTKRGKNNAKTPASINRGPRHQSWMWFEGNSLSWMVNWWSHPLASKGTPVQGCGRNS